jgi:hypothetical protein
MRKQALVMFAVVLGAAFAALVALSLVSDRSLAFTLGVRADAAVVKLAPEDEVCQRPIEVVEAFDRVQIQLGTYHRPATPYVLSVRQADGGRALADARVTGGYEDSVVQSVRLSREVSAGRQVAVCIRNTAARPVAVYGSSDLANRSSTSYLDGNGTGADLMIVFQRPSSESEIALMPAIVRRASLFHGAWASPAAYWVLLPLLLGTLAVLPALALRSALARAPDGE